MTRIVSAASQHECQMTIRSVRDASVLVQAERFISSGTSGIHVHIAIMPLGRLNALKCVKLALLLKTKNKNVQIDVLCDDYKDAGTV